MGSTSRGRQLGRVARTRIAIALPALMLLAISCGGEDTPSETSATPPPQPPGTRQIAVPGTGNNPVVAEVATGELPAGYPADLPVPPDSEPANAMLIPGQGGLITFTSTASRQDVSDFYQTSLPDQGWSVDESTEEATRTLIKASKAGRKASVAIADGASGTEVAITLQGG